MTVACDRVRDLASGYVLGALEPAEMAAVRRHLASCRKPHPELGEMGGVLAYLGAALPPVEPRSALKGAVLAAAKADLVARRAVHPIAAIGAPAEISVFSLAEARASRGRRMALWLGRAAAVLVIIAGLGYAMGIPGRIGLIHPTDSTIGGPCSWCYDAGSFGLSPGPGSNATGAALVRDNGHLLVFGNKLQTTRNDEIYAVWLTADNGSSQRAAEFRVDSSGRSGTIEIDNLPPASTLKVTITLEARPGAAEPTGPIILSGATQL